MAELDVRGEGPDRAGNVFAELDTKVTRAATRTGKGEPRSARTARQASIMQPDPAIAAASAASTEYQCSLDSPAETAGHSSYSPYEQQPSTTASTRPRIQALARSRLSMAKGYPSIPISITS